MAPSSPTSMDPTDLRSSAVATHRRGISSCFAPLDSLHLDSSSFAGPVVTNELAHDSPILGDLTNGARSLLSPTTSPNGEKSSSAIKKEWRVESSNRLSATTQDVLQDEQRQNKKALNHTAPKDQCPSKRRRVGKSNVSKEQNCMFVSESDSEESIEEDVWIFESEGRSGELGSRRYSKRIVQEPKIKKAGQARRQFAVSACDADEKKIISDFCNWKQEEQMRKGGVGTLDPNKIYYDVRDSIRSDGNEDAESDYTAAQVALMILSLGSTNAIVELKAIIKDMRGISQTEVVRPPVKFGKDLEKILTLVRWVYNSTNNGTPLDNFQSRYYISSFCNYVIARREDLMRKHGGKTAEDAQRQVYAGLIAKAYPRIPRYRNTRRGAAKKETTAFKEAVSQLQTKSERGYRWLTLRKMFGVGIMALYYDSLLFSETARLSLDDKYLSEQEFNLLVTYLSTKGNAHSAWLQLLCDKIKAHITQGADQILVLPELLLEKCTVEQIVACREQSGWLSMMCETLEGVLKRPGNKVTADAWFSIDRHTKIADWQRGVQEGVHKEAQGEAQL